MEDKIEIGEYVRTREEYIGKLKQIKTVNNSEICVLDINGKEHIAKKSICKKHSYNIKDLVETGDFINGCKVITEGNSIFYECEKNLDGRKPITEEDIGAILTLTMFYDSFYYIRKK